ncbi:hypothetical protein HDV03_002702 [Kappamyces sp. JEL0829]|nr:hypothetical protein HDV03_002702 [Kappamyces sp. JEL0829]
MASLCLFLQVVVYSAMNLNTAAATNSNLLTSVYLGHLTTFFTTCGSIHRYMFYMSEKKRTLANILACACVSVVSLYLMAVNGQSVVSAANIYQVNYGDQSYLLAVIPFAHLVLGIILLYEGVRQKMGTTARLSSFMTVNMTFTTLIIIIWLVYLVTCITLVFSVGLTILFEAVAIECENHVAVISEAVASDPSQNNHS